MEKINVVKASKQLQQIRQPLQGQADFQRIKVTHGPLGRQLQNPITVEIPTGLDKQTMALYEYVIGGLSALVPKLIPFALANRSIMKMAKYYLRYASGSRETLKTRVYAIDLYCRSVSRTPDQLIDECVNPDGTPRPRVLHRHRQLLDDWIGCLEADNLAPSTISSYVASVKALYQRNGLDLKLLYPPRRRTRYHDRAPRPEELQRMIDLAGLRGKVIVSWLALGGFRESTLVQLRYRHVREDLERGVVPVHVHVEAEITKGKYHDYDTFLGPEAVEYIKAYLDMRTRGSPRGYIPPEEIHDESPLIRDKRFKEPRPVQRDQIYNEVHNLYLRAGLLRKRRGRMYRLRPHSIRKYFRTQLAALGVDRDYIEYMMGHTVSTYHDIQMNGIEFLRNIYVASGLSIRPKTQPALIDTLKAIIRAHGENPEKYLMRKALAEPHRVYATPGESEEDHIKALSQALKEMLRKELLQP